MLVDWLIPLGALLISLLLTPLIRRIAIKRQLVDIPNLRSSHERPTPRGGGLAIVVGCLVSLILLGIFHYVSFCLVVGFVVGGLLVAAISFLDDHGHVSPYWRVAVHFVAAISAYFFIGGATLVFHMSFTGWLFSAFLVVSVVWVLNLYNFMDGVDGIAGAETVFVGVSSAIFFGINDVPDMAQISVLLVAATTGFLVWNLPPASIFMGDVGSGFLGIFIGLLALAGIMSGAVNIWVWVILLGVFLVDATVTIGRRIICGSKWWEAHRSHAYQHLAIKWKSHGKVTLAVTCINVFWLFPWAFAAWCSPLKGFFFALIAYTPLIWLTIHFKAGKEEKCFR